MTQNDRVLDLLRSRGPRGITALDALEHVGSMRLAARIADLRALGYDIDSEMVPTARGARVARYTLHEPVPVEPVAAGQVELGL